MSDADDLAAILGPSSHRPGQSPIGRGGIVAIVSLDRLLPRWHFREHHRRATTAPAAALLAAAEELTWREVVVMRALLGIRSAGRLHLAGTEPILDGMAKIGFTVLERTDDELVVGALGRPWDPRGGRKAPRLADRAAPAEFFARFDEPGWAKMIVNFRVGAGELSTETRVLATDEHARRAFARYWLLIRPFSGLIRRRWLAAIARRADRFRDR